METIAAHNLIGLTLPNDWYVKSKIERTSVSSGGTFSVGYIVEKNRTEYFMKALNFATLLSMKRENQSIVDLMQEMIEAYTYERDLSIYCKKNKVTKVAFVIDSGEISIDGYTYPLVPYLIFEKADGDIRNVIAYSECVDFAWKLKSLHDIAVGLRQLHTINVSHQDLKPSNILVYPNNNTKISDLGRSMCPALNGPYDEALFSGDYNYAPPEIMARLGVKDWQSRTYSTDCYLLGSLIVFYISGTSMSALLVSQLNPIRNGNAIMLYNNIEEMETYLLDAYYKCLRIIRNDIPVDDVKERLINIISLLCHPNPIKRGHPRNILSKGSNYSLERFISELDLIYRIVKLKLIK